MKLLRALTLALMLSLVLTVPAFADYSTKTGTGFGKPDSNQYVPEYVVEKVGTCSDNVLAVTHYEYDSKAWYGPHVMWIEYDRCEMKRLGATAAGWERLKAHERAHSRGFAHGEGDPKYNDAHSPIVNVK